MSHFTELKTSLKNKKHILSALKKLGYHIIQNEKSPVSVRGFFGETIPADFKIETSTKYDIGFKKTLTGEYEVIGDWELLPKVSKINKADFLNEVKKEYARSTILTLAKEKGYHVHTVENNGTLELTVEENI